jgi:hypothetical protein
MCNYPAVSSWPKEIHEFCYEQEDVEFWQNMLRGQTQTSKTMHSKLNYLWRALNDIRLSGKLAQRHKSLFRFPDSDLHYISLYGNNGMFHEYVVLCIPTRNAFHMAIFQCDISQIHIHTQVNTVLCYGLQLLPLQ